MNIKKLVFTGLLIIEVYVFDVYIAAVNIHNWPTLCWKMVYNLFSSPPNNKGPLLHYIGFIKPPHLLLLFFAACIKRKKKVWQGNRRSFKEMSNRFSASLCWAEPHRTFFHANRHTHSLSQMHTLTHTKSKREHQISLQIVDTCHTEQNTKILLHEWQSGSSLFCL